MSTLSVLSVLLGVGYARLYQKTCDPTDYGAKGDGKNDDTEAIQKAMDACYKNDAQGLVSLPKDKKFLSYHLSIASSDNIGLEFQSGAEFVLGDDKDKWHDESAFLLINDCTNVEISGSGGKINGQGDEWWKDDDKGPVTIYLDHSHNVNIKDIKIENCPYHCIEAYADNVEIDSISIENPSDSHNTDGIDVHGDPFHIKNSYISTGDDNVAVHASNVLVEYCHFGTGHGATIGSMSSGEISNITFDNIQFNGTDNGAHIKTDENASGGSVKDVHYTNLRMSHVDMAIRIQQNYDGAAAERVGLNESHLVIEDVYIENVSFDKSNYPGDIQCQSSSPCKNINFKNVKGSAEKKDYYSCSDASGSYSDCDPSPSCLKS